MKNKWKPNNNKLLKYINNNLKYLTNNSKQK